MKVLAVVPLPPPVSGQSKASQAAVDGLRRAGLQIDVVNFAKDTPKSGVTSLRRVGEVLHVLFQIARKRRNCDLVYLSLSESGAGNLKDLCTYVILRRKISCLTVHMLGGANMREILSGRGPRARVNKFFLSKARAILVEGQTNHRFFSDSVPHSNVVIAPNFPDEYLRTGADDLNLKFRPERPLEVLFLSNLLPGKGYEELAKAVLTLPPEIRSALQVSFVGAFVDKAHEREFLRMISNEPSLRYLGRFIDGAEKKDLYAKSDVFCLPTYYFSEGQPIALLEAYASGLAVVATTHSGLADVFVPGVNGLVVEERSVDSLGKALLTAIQLRGDLRKFSETNQDQARQKFTRESFDAAVVKAVRGA